MSENTKTQGYSSMDRGQPRLHDDALAEPTSNAQDRRDRARSLIAAPITPVEKILQRNGQRPLTTPAQRSDRSENLCAAMDSKKA